MKKKVTVSLIQFSPKLLQVDKNIERMIAFAYTEAANGADLIVFPELANTGYVEPAIPGEPVSFGELSYADFAPLYVRASETVPGKTSDALAEIAHQFGTLIVVGLAQKHPVIPATVYNSSVLIGPSGIIGIYNKIHLWQMEKLFFSPGNSADVFKTGIGIIGMQICYDIRFPEITRILALKGAEIVCCIWSSFYPIGKSTQDPDLFKHRAYTRAQENGLFFLCCNRAGIQGSNRFFGRSVVASPNGNVLAASDSENEEIIRADLDEDALVNYRSFVNIFSDRRPHLYQTIVSEPFVSTAVSVNQRKEEESQFINGTNISNENY